MNGQPYNYSGSNSGNGTPTPSSTSYPASLSSQSSRDASPIRQPSNHVNADKANNYSSQRYQAQEYASLHQNNHNDNLIGSRSQVPVYPLDSSSQLYRHQGGSTSAPTQGLKMEQHLDPQSELYRPENNYYQEPNKVQEQPVGYDQISNHTYVNQPLNDESQKLWSPNSSSYIPPTKPTSNLYTPGGVDPYNAQVSSTAVTQQNVSRPVYPANYQPYPPGVTVQPYSNVPGKPPVQTALPTREEPLSSGPPRTNALGIIPYTTDPVTAMSQSNIASPKTLSAAQLSSNHVAQNVKPSPPLLNSPPQPQHNLYNQPYQYQQQQLQQQQPPLPSQQLQQQQMPPSQVGMPPLPPSQPQAPRLPPLQQSQQPTKPYPNQYANATAYNSTNNYLQNQPQQTPVYNYNQTQNNVGYANYNSGPVGYYPGADDLVHQMAGMTVNAGYNKLWGREAVDLLKSREILPTHRVEPPSIRLAQEFGTNCSPEIFRCTLTKIPETKSLLDKSRLPLGVLIHPFKDLNQLSVIQCSVIVRCRSCRTYINPFVYFVDSKRWKCNLCFRDNELPEEFQYDPLTKTYGDPSRRPEIKSATIEFIAPSEYMVRPPQPAAYVFVIDVSRLGAEAGYLKAFCDCLLSQLEALPGDSRTSVAFITFDSTVHYYSLAETQALPHQMVVVDIDDMFVPCPDNLLVNLSECLGLVRDLLKELPFKYNESFDTGSALGPALQAAYKLLAATGGRITVFQSCLANSGPGKLHPREDPSQRSGENVNQAMLNPITDFYKKLALDCSGQQIAVDLFILNSQYVDLASLSGISKFSGGCIHHFPLFSSKNPLHVESLNRCMHRYLCRKIGFESVMRLRCTRGLSIHTFHGNFFVRSTDLLSLPNVNPDAGFGMQVSIDENLSDIQHVCFQAALLYTSSKGERRIRVHTLCLPIASNLSDVLHSADQQCIAGLLAKMAVDRCHQSSLSDAREAFVNVVADMLSAYRLTQSSNPSTSLLAPPSLRLLPLYVLALLKSIAFRVGQSTRLDDRMFAMCQMKSQPLSQLIQMIYPDLYPVHNLCEYSKVNMGEETVVQPPLLHLTAERIDSHGVYLMDDGSVIMIYVGHNISPALALALFNAPSFSSINTNMTELPELENEDSRELRNFVNYLQNEKPIAPTVEVIRDDSPHRQRFLEKLIEDKTETGYSYYEFLQRVKQLVK